MAFLVYDGRPLYAPKLSLEKKKVEKGLMLVNASDAIDFGPLVTAIRIYDSAERPRCTNRCSYSIP